MPRLARDIEHLLAHRWRRQGRSPPPRLRAARAVAVARRDIDSKVQRKEYCLGEKLFRRTARKEGWYSEVHYILTTGANWKGPIGRFKLTLAKRSPRDVISTCIPDTRRVSDTTFEVVRESFTPTEDLKILFIPGR